MVAIATGVMGSPIWGQEIETAVTSFVIGGITLQEDVKNPPVPSGMQRFEITMNKPVVTFNELREPETLPYFDGDSITQVTITKYFDIDRDVISYPIDLLLDITIAQDLAISPDSLTLTGTISLPEGATYQVLFGASDIDPIDEQQQYFLGTAEMSGASISGVGIVETLPDGFTVSDDRFAGAALIAPERFRLIFPLLEEFDDFILWSFVRITDSNEQMTFDLKHVPDGSYAILMAHRLVNEQTGQEIQIFGYKGVNLLTGEVDPTELVQVVDGKSVTDLQIVLQIPPEEPEPVISEIMEINVQSVSVETNSFIIQLGNQQIQIDASNALMVSLGQTSAEDILEIFFSGNTDDLLRLFFPITDLMAGDTVSILGVSLSETMFQALMVMRHGPPLARNGDIDRDGDVDFSDFLLFTSAFGTMEGEPEYNPAADLDGDGAVVFSDFLIFASTFGKPVG